MNRDDGLIFEAFALHKLISEEQARTVNPLDHISFTAELGRHRQIGSELARHHQPKGDWLGHIIGSEQEIELTHNSLFNLGATETRHLDFITPTHATFWTTEDKLYAYLVKRNLVMISNETPERFKKQKGGAMPEARRLAREQWANLQLQEKIPMSGRHRRGFELLKSQIPTSDRGYEEYEFPQNFESFWRHFQAQQEAEQEAEAMKIPPSSITRTTPPWLKKEGGKQTESPDPRLPRAADRRRASPDPLVKQAHEYQSLMDSGKFRSRAALARWLRVPRYHVVQALNRLASDPAFPSRVELARDFQSLMDSGVVKSRSDLARFLGIPTSRVTNILNSFLPADFKSEPGHDYQALLDWARLKGRTRVAQALKWYLSKKLI